ncbi:MAG: hypothetical protein WCX28_10960 [Bacteriovoracaceae bacterium]|nr:hypothetical protein [Bacteroidota bacterium]
MKKNLTILCVIVGTALGQNPDGNAASLHLSPVWTWGSTDYYRTTSIWYPPTQASPEQAVMSEDEGSISNPIAFGFSTLLKIPASSYFTLSVSYSFQQRFEEFDKSETAKKYFSQYWTMNGAMHSMGLTLSIYNLFSIY